MYQITGKIHTICDKQQKTDTFAIRDLIITVENITKKGDYSYPVSISFINDNIALLDGQNVKDALIHGNDVTVEFTIHGKQANNGVVYNNLKGTRIIISPLKEQPQQRQSRIPDVYAGMGIEPKKQTEFQMLPDNINDDLPF